MGKEYGIVFYMNDFSFPPSFTLAAEGKRESYRNIHVEDPMKNAFEYETQVGIANHIGLYYHSSTFLLCMR